MADIIASAEVTILDVMDGVADNLYLAYADNADGSVGFGFTPKPTSTYIGTYKSKETTQSNDRTRYKWLRHSGADGQPGPKGEDGAVNITCGFTQGFSDSFTAINAGVGAITTLSDGWAKFKYTNSTSATQRVDFYLPKIDGLTENQPYTFLQEVRNNKSSASMYFYFVQDNASAFWGNDPDSTLQVSGNVKRTVRVPKTNTITLAQASRLVTVNVNVPAGATLDVETRISFYTGNYMGPYIPFQGGKTGSKGADGIAGKDGVGIKSTAITYGLSASDSTQPSTWTASVPTLVKGQYLWTKTVWTYSDNATETGYVKTYIAKDGNNGNDGIAGKDGVGIKTTSITYGRSTSGTSNAGITWTSVVPSVLSGQYLWTKTVWTYSDNTTETGYSVAKMGDTGPKGDDGRSSYIHTAYANSPDGSVQFSTIESEGRRYVGMYTDFSVADSTDYTRYKWVDMSGDIKPGGENYLSDWLFEDDYVWYTSSGTPSTAMTKTRLENGVLECRSTNNDWNQLQINSRRGSVETSPGFKNIISGQPYTLSFWMRHVDSPALQVTTLVRLNKKPNGDKNYLQKTFDLTAEWKKYEVTGVISYDINVVDYWRTLFVTTSPGTFQIKRPVLEWGNVATDGAPSPYDAKKAIDAVSDKLTVDLNKAVQLAQDALASANAIARELQNQPYYKITEQTAYEATQAKLRRTSEEQLTILNGRTTKIVEYLGDMTAKLVFQSKALTVGEEGVMFASKDLAQAVKINDNRISFHTGGSETAAFTGGELNIDRVNVSTKLQKGNFIEEPDDQYPTLMIVRYKE